jgi:chitinase
MVDSLAQSFLFRLTRSDDMMGFTKETGPKIWSHVDFINVMSYDLINRRNKLSWHHTSVVDSEDTIKNYLAIGAPPEKLNLGFAYYAKYFTTDNNCSPTSPLNCTLIPAEDATGKDTKTSGTWTFEAQNMVLPDPKTLKESTNGLCGPAQGTKCPKGNCCSEYGFCGATTSADHCTGACWHAFGEGCTGKDIAGSWHQAASNSVCDDEFGGQYYFDDANKLFWTWDTPELITRKFDDIVAKYKLGGVMAWALGEDGYDYSHIHQMAEELEKHPSQPDGTPTASPTAPASSGYAAPPPGSTDDAASSQPADTSPAAPEPTSDTPAPSSYAAPPPPEPTSSKLPADTPTPSPPATETEPASYSPTQYTPPPPPPPQSQTYAAPPSVSTDANGCECHCPATPKGARETAHAHAHVHVHARELGHGNYGRAGRRLRG